MARTSIPTLNLEDYLSKDEQRKSHFIQALGDALTDIGFFALTGHGIELRNIQDAYRTAKDFFSLSDDIKEKYEEKQGAKERGFIPFGIEHAKDNPSPDLKEFWQTGRTLDNTHPKYHEFPKNVWPNADLPEYEGIIDNLFLSMENLSLTLLEACALYLNEDKNWLTNMAADGNTILRVIHYPPISKDADPQSVRSAAHEDINLITLLVGATADGLEVQDHDGSWIAIQGSHDHIIVDTGDMIQNLTNGLFKATTHRVVNPKDATGDRYSMPLFVHPRNEIDLTPRQKFIQMTGGEMKYPSITAGEYLQQRLAEIGLKKS